MYKARHARPAKHRITLPMLVLVAAMIVGILVFPTPASGADTNLDAVSGERGVMAATGSDTYSVVPSAQHGGAVKPSVSDSAAGETVTFEVAPENGFETASVSVITSSGSVIEVLRVKGETYKFVMPTEGVVIDVAFQYKRA